MEDPSAGNSRCDQGISTQALNVFMLWYQGFDRAPALVRRLHSIWRRQLEDQPGIKPRFLAGSDADDLIQSQGIDPSGLTMQVRADLVRVHLLAEEGGVWADATLLPSRPLNSWLSAELKSSGFFAFRNAARDRMLSNWFLFADRGNYAVTRWRDVYFDYFRSPRKLNKHAPWHILAAQEFRVLTSPASFGRPSVAQNQFYYPYRIQHYLFAYLYRTDPVFADVWNRTPHEDAGTAGQLKKLISQLNNMTTQAELLAIIQSAPLHKLNWRKSELINGILDEIETLDG